MGKAGCAMFKCTPKPNTSRHRFPNPANNLNTFSLWMSACSNRMLDYLTQEEIHSNYYVCSDHFETKQYLNIFSKRLMRYAVPTKNLPNSTNIESVNTEENVVAGPSLLEVYEAALSSSDSEDDQTEIELTAAECSKLFQQVKKLEQELEEAKSKYLKCQAKLKELKRQKMLKENKQRNYQENKDLNNKWVNSQFEWSDRITRILKEQFHFKSFRSKQLAAINATLAKKDVLLVMPTGGGKSLVYQLPALIDKGFTLVVSPLISLIEDQLHSLKSHNIGASTIHGSTSKSDTKSVYEEMTNANSKTKLLYVTPEWIAKSKRFMAVLKKAYEAQLVARVAIDEVHCCSSWGHDFRPDYSYLGILRQTLANTPFIGLTATATMTVLTDIQTMLNMEDSMIITAPFNRPNLFYQVLPKPSKDETVKYLARLLSDKYANQSGIIYTTTISDSTNLANDLRKEGIKAAPYHAQLEAEDRKKIHHKWINKTYQVVIATVAFGMGIDKADVRFVIHHSMPKSMESLYQESGRAGRDGKNADCIVLFSLNDYFRILGMVSSLVDEKKAKSILEYCLEQKKCRRSLLAQHFEETWEQNDCKEMCDHCTANHGQFYVYDLRKCCLDLNAIIEKSIEADEKLTLNKLMDGWFQTGPKKLRADGLTAPKFSREQGERIISYLIMKSYFGIDKGYTSYSTICYIKKNMDDFPSKVPMMSSGIFLGLSKEICDNAGNGPKMKKQKV